MNYNKKSVAVIGLGYIGLPTGALLATNGYFVKGVDLNKRVVDTINKGDIHIIEPELDRYVQSAVKSGNLVAYSEVQACDIYIICVPTPFKENTNIPTPNIDYVINAAQSIATHIKDGDIVILESTSPVGTTEKVQNVLQKSGVDISKVFLAYCPERVLPGKIMKEIVTNDRIIGGINSQSAKVVSSFYKTFVKGKVLPTEARTAEMCKLTENSFRDVNIAFANELSMICDNSDINVWELIKLANHHPRVNILQPGTGVGGHCIAVDPWFIASEDPRNSKLIQTSRAVNDLKPEWVVNKIEQQAKIEKIKNITCLGMSFKPDIDDLRESPAITVINMLIKRNYNVSCIEPNINSHDKYHIVDFENTYNMPQIVVVLVAHKQFTSQIIKKHFQNQKILDFCGILQQ